MPSMPMLSTPLRSAISSPSAVKSSGTPATTPPASNAVNTACCNSSDIALSPAQCAREPGRQVAAAQVSLGAQILGNGHEEQDHADQHQQEIGRQTCVTRGILTADRNHGIEGD